MNERPVISINLDLTKVHHPSAPAMPIGAPSIDSRFGVAPLCLKVATLDLVGTQREEVGFGSYRAKIHAAPTKNGRADSRRNR